MSFLCIVSVYHCCVTTPLFLGRQTQHICILTPDRSPRTDQSTDTATVQLGEAMSFIEVTNRNMGERLPIEAEMIQKHLHYPSPPQLR